MTKTEICLKYLNGVMIEESDENYSDEALSITTQMIKLGYMPTQRLIDALMKANRDDLMDFYFEAMPILQKFKGAGVEWKPLYPNFPKQVIEADEADLLANAVQHYWSKGTWLPDTRKEERGKTTEATKFQTIDLTTEDKYLNIFTKLLSSNDSISSSDKKTIEWFLDNETNLKFPDQIPFKENMCLLAGISLAKDIDISPIVHTATDILRIATYLSDGDISLGQNSKFKSFPRKVRRQLVQLLEKVIREEDISRHENKWKHLFHSLHIGEYTFAERTNKAAEKIRNNINIKTFNTYVEEALQSNDISKVVKYLKQRPGEYVRRFDHILRLGINTNKVIEGLEKIVNEVPTRVLLQLLGHIKTRTEDIDKRVVFPKGSIQKAILVEKPLKALDSEIIEHVVSILKSTLENRFSSLETLGKVWIDPKLKNAPIPSQQRSASESKRTVARGTRLPMSVTEDQNTIRLFLYWVGQDIDLSAILYDKDLNHKEDVGYYNLRSANNATYHSGDITNAPDGACEFIDIDVAKTLANGIRYVCMDVRVYSGPSFAQHDTCFVGWMSREYPNSNELFDPSTVQMKIDIAADASSASVVIFDLETKEAIWTDLSMNVSSFKVNNAQNNRAGIEDILNAAILNSNKVSLYELFEMHAKSRGTLVEKEEEAETIFSLDVGVTPYDITDINADYIV